MSLPIDFHLEKRFYYSRLNDKEKELYRFLLELLLQNKRKFIYTWVEDFDRNVEELKGLPEFICSPSEANIYNVFDSILWDCPELYYVHEAVLLFNDYWFDFFPVSVVTVTDDMPDGKPQYTDEEIAELNEKLYAHLREFDGIEDEFELELAVHDYATKHFDYDHKYQPNTKITERSHFEIFTVAGLLKTGKAVCGGLTCFIQFVLQRRGLTVANILALISEGDEKTYHAWLAVKLGGSFYHLDLTYNEGYTFDLATPQYMYFNVTDKEILEDGREFTHQEYPEIVCNATEYNYYYKKGLYFTDSEKLKNSFCQYLQGIDKSKDVYFYYFRTPIELSEEEIKKGLLQGLKESKLKVKPKGVLYLDCDGYYAVEIHPAPDENETENK